MKKAFCFGVVIVILILSTAHSFAKLTMIPSISVRETYNDNIFLTRTDREHDFITTIFPHIDLQYSPSRLLDLSLDYGLNFRYYARHSNLSDTSIRQTQDANFQTQVRPFNRIFIDVSDVYRRVAIDVRRNVALDNSFRNMTDSNVFRISPHVEYPLTSTLLSRFGYGYTNTWYDAEEGNDSNSHSAFVSLVKQFPFLLNVSVNYNFLAYRPELTNDYDSHRGSVAVNYQVGPHWIIWAGVGKTYINFSNSSNGKKDFWNVGSEYRLNILGGTTLRAVYSNSLSDTEGNVLQNKYLGSEYIFNTESQSLQPGSFNTRDKSSITLGIIERERVDIHIITGTDFKITINPYYIKDEAFRTDPVREDRILGVVVDITKSLSTKMLASLNGLWEKQKFSPEDKKVQRYSLGGSLDYKLSKSITTSIGYRYNNRNSDIDTEDFNNNIVWLQAKVTF